MPLQFGPFTLDSDRRQLLRAREAVHLSPKAFDVLCLLAERRPNAVSKSELYERVWPSTFVVDANLAVLVAEIRRALDDDPRAPRFIRTVHRFGYAFCSDVSQPAGVPAAATPLPKAWLVRDDRVMLLQAGENVVGRDPGCAVWVDVPGVSRRHARIIVDDAAVVEDLDSKNGTFVDGQPVRGARPLTDGAVVRFGPVEMRFRLWADALGSDTVRLVT